MAKKAYIGISNKARKIKKGYLGVLVNGIEAGETLINSTNMLSYFNVENGSVQFTEANNIFTSTTHKAYIKFTALFPFNAELNFTAHAFNAARESFTVTINGSQAWYRECDDGYPASSSWSGNLNTGDTIEFQLSESGHVYTGDGIKATFSIKVIIPQNIPAKGMARQIKKAYIGIGNIARPCWPSGEIEYFGAITPLNKSRRMHAGVGINNYLLFVGGINCVSAVNSYPTTMEYYNNSLTLATKDVGFSRIGGMSSISNGTYGLFGGGQDESSWSKTIYAYNNSLTVTNPTELTNNAQSRGTGTAGQYMIFAGGNTSASGWYPTYYADVDAYNSALTKVSCPSMASPRGMGTGDICGSNMSTVSNVAIIGGGYTTNNGTIYTVESYNSSLTRSAAASNLSFNDIVTAKTAGNYVLFFQRLGTTVEAYDSSLTKTTSVQVQSVGRKYPASVTFSNQAIIAGGTDGSSVYKTIDIYDGSLTRTNNFQLSISRSQLMGAANENCAILAGGWYITSDGGNAATAAEAEAFIV